MKIKLAEGAVLPKRGSEGASGYDLVAMDDHWIDRGASVIIPTGVSLELYAGMEAQVRPRSSMSRRGIMIPLGTIDSDYRGEIGVVAFNASSGTLHIAKGDRIAQLVFAQVFHPTFELADELSTTERGSGGWGSTGR